MDVRFLPRLVVLVALLLGSGLAMAPAEVAAQRLPQPGPCVDGVLPHGALSRVCVPASGWNGDLVVWAHGYIAVTEPLDFYHIELPGGISLSDLIQSLGFAFATTSYRQNGLTVLEGVEDVRELLAAVPAVAGRQPTRTYMTGASAGGLIATLVVERYPGLISGGLAACGPIGDFRMQVDYVGDFRVLFDYFFPAVIPGSAIEVPAEVMANWESHYVPAITARLTEHPARAAELIRTARAPIDRTSPEAVAASTITTAINVLWYAAFGTNDGAAKLGGNPYGNRGRVYSGSSDDQRLNAEVARFDASPTALITLARYQTSGRLLRPLVTLHTTHDEVILFRNEALYRAKARPAGDGTLVQLPVDRYGHCNFTPAQVLLALGRLVKEVTGNDAADIQRQVELLKTRSIPPSSWISPTVR
jgi:hypothetical protein